MIELARRRTGSPPALVTLVRGDMRELETIEAAVRLAAPLRATLIGGILPGRPGAGLDLLRSLAGDCVGAWYPWADLAARVTRDDVRGLLISADTWRGAPRALWKALDRCPLLIQRRRPPDLPRQALLAVDSARTSSALAEIVQRMPAHTGLGVTAVYASLPTWACSVSAALGYPVAIGESVLDDFPWSLPPGASGVCITATPQWGIRTLVEQLRPDLVVLGLHRHRLRLPWLAHPTAWQLSRDLPTDVLLCPVSPAD